MPSPCVQPAGCLHARARHGCHQPAGPLLAFPHALPPSHPASNAPAPIRLTARLPSPRARQRRGTHDPGHVASKPWPHALDLCAASRLSTRSSATRLPPTSGSTPRLPARPPALLNRPRTLVLPSALTAQLPSPRAQQRRATHGPGHVASKPWPHALDLCAASRLSTRSSATRHPPTSGSTFLWSRAAGTWPRAAATGPCG